MKSFFITFKDSLGESFGYATAIRSLTQGRASYSLEFDSYEETTDTPVSASGILATG